MEMNSKNKTNFLIVDTTGFIRNTQVQDIANNVLTTPSVVKEVTSKSQLRRLVVLPYDLTVKEPDPEYIAIVSAFAKQTGDYQSLSATDIQVIALTYQIECQEVGRVHLRSEPLQPAAIEPQGLPSKEFKEVVGFYLPSKVSESEDEKHDEGTNISDQIEYSLSSEENVNDDDEVEEGSDVGYNEESEDIATESEEFADDDQADDDDSGWITPSNIKSLKQKIISEVEEDAPEVACLTTDFAMQNVLKRIGLNIVTVDGRAIKELRTFILRCYACFKITSVMSKLFCPKCGNKTLKKVAVTTNSDGTQQIHINFRRPLTSRGKRYSLPTPKGGKHANNPILCEDQPIPQQRVTKVSRMKNNPLDDDYIAGFSPFVVRDVNSRAAMLGIRPNAQVKQWMRRNPNESNKPGGRKRK